MYKIFRRVSFLYGVKNDGILLPTNSINWILSIKNSTGIPNKEANKENLGCLPDEITSFSSFLEERQEQARRSAIIKIKQYSDWAKVAYMCSSCGKVNQIFHYIKNQDNFVLVEMNTQEELKNFLEFGGIFKSHSNILNHFYIFPNKGFNESYYLCKNLEKNVVFNTPIKAKTHLIEKLIKNQTNVSEQILELYNCLKLNELGIRLRFLTGRQIEVLFLGIAPGMNVFPFGSSVTGLGLNGCDLDLVALTTSNCFLLPFSYNISGKIVTKAHIQLISKIIETFFLDCQNIFCIKNASVPIVKYNQMFTTVDCDLSLYNANGVVASQMLYTFGLLDKLFRPLVFILKIWALNKQLCKKPINSSFSSFMITLLVIYFFQQKTTCRLPCWDIFPSENEFLLEESKLFAHLFHSKQSLSKDKSLEELLYLFFVFYESFNFEKYGISLKTGKEIVNVAGCPILIQNPLEPTLNVSKNVNFVELKNFKRLCKEARKIIEAKNEILIKLLLNREYDFSEPMKESFPTIFDLSKD